MTDLISRQAAIDALSMMQGIVAENGVRKGVSLAWQQIKDLPSAHCDNCPYPDEYVKEKEDALRWIPVTERLPEEDGGYLTTYSIDWYRVGTNTFIDGKWTFDRDEVIAWQPLPEPYEEDKA